MVCELCDFCLIVGFGYFGGLRFGVLLFDFGVFVFVFVTLALSLFVGCGNVFVSLCYVDCLWICFVLRVVLLLICCGLLLFLISCVWILVVALLFVI